MSHTRLVSMTHFGIITCAPEIRHAHLRYGAHAVPGLEVPTVVHRSCELLAVHGVVPYRQQRFFFLLFLVNLPRQPGLSAPLRRRGC